MANITKWISYIERCNAQYRNAELQDLGLNTYNYMYIIYLNKNPGISQDDLTRLLHINKSNVARSLKNLEDNDFIIRKQDTDDKRIFRVYPTIKAKDTFPILINKMRKWNDIILEGLNEEDIEKLKSILQHVLNNASIYTNRIYTEDGEEDETHI